MSATYWHSDLIFLNLILVGEAYSALPELLIVVEVPLKNLIISPWRGPWKSLNSEVAEGRLPCDALFDALFLLLAQISCLASVCKQD